MKKDNFTLFIENPTSKVTISYNKQGYEQFKKEIAIPLKTGLEIKLKKISRPTVFITQLDFGAKLPAKSKV
jgi:C4-type Zn-finger protein